MKYIVDNDLHIHSRISECSSDPLQTAERILDYAKQNGLKTIAVTDHFWDETVPGASDWYKPQNFERISKIKPLPRFDGIEFLFGCETELDKNLNLGLSRENMDLFDFIVIPTTHFHMKGYTLSDEEGANAESRAKAWLKRIDAVLDMDLPFHKIGLAHLTCDLIGQNREECLEVLTIIPEEELKRVFSKAAKCGVGIELNSFDMSFSDEEAETVMRIYKVAKACGCKFYFGSDAHHPQTFEVSKANFEKAVRLLGLTEEDKFIIAK